MSRLLPALAVIVLATVCADAASAQSRIIRSHAPHPARPTASAPAAPTPTVYSDIGALLANPQSRAVVEAHAPALTASPELAQYQHMTLPALAQQPNTPVTPDAVAAIDADLRALPAH
ncbi:hypothetical protein BH10PSE2_BH10PSE2_09120 [soil metagenome]